MEEAPSEPEPARAGAPVRARGPRRAGARESKAEEPEAPSAVEEPSAEAAEGRGAAEPDAGDTADLPAVEPEPESTPAPAAQSGGGEGSEGARLIALNMALNGTPREETARYLDENFDLADQNTILDEVYARVGG